MDNEIQLISDGDGLAVIGDPTDVERFLVSEGLASKDLGLPRARSRFDAGAAAAQAGASLRPIGSLGEADQGVRPGSSRSTD